MIAVCEGGMSLMAEITHRGKALGLNRPHAVLTNIGIHEDFPVTQPPDRGCRAFLISIAPASKSLILVDTYTLQN